MSTQTWLRDVRRLLDDLDVEYRLEHGTKHVKFYVSKGGRRGVLTVAMSPSDTNAIHAVRRQLTRTLALVR